MTHAVSHRRFSAFCADMHGSLVSYARKFVDADSAEDLVQEAFLRAIESPRASAGDLPLAYYKTIVRNLAMDLFAKRVRDRQLNEKALGLCGTDAGISRSQDLQLLDEDLRERLAELSQRQWESLIMTVVMGMTEHEAASAAHVSRSAVTGSRERAIEWLRRSLPEKSPESSRVPRVAC